jgi:N-acetylmuramoyl-L-alanine amidase
MKKNDGLVQRHMQSFPLWRLCFVTLTCIFLIGALMIGSSASVVFPEDSTPTKVYLDGNEVLAGECIILQSVTYVPLRNFCNLFEDCKITWDSKTSTATVRTEDLLLTVQSGAIYITANGHYYYTVEAVRNLNGHLYVPIRPLAKAFAAELSWNAATRSVELHAAKNGVNAVPYANYNQDDLYWLSRIISAESRGEPLLGQIAVGNVVLNRVKSPSYPNTVYGVIFDRKHGTQFSPVALGTIYNKPSASSVIAAKICLEGYSLSNSALFFLNPRIATNNWIVKNRQFAFRIGNHDFYN